MAHARVEEVSDSDISDPEEMDLSDLNPGSIIRPANTPPAAAPRQPSSQSQNMPPAGPQGLMPQMRDNAEDARQREAVKRWQSLYPIYFDATRTKKEGRRIGKEHAVKNPLAREIAEAVASLGLNVALEPSKLHPQDWANPGRVKVQFKDDGALRNTTIDNKRFLYIKVAEWLNAHPTTKETPMKLPVHGLPSKSPAEPNVPRGRKMSKILPMHSPAVTGGGVSENMFKDMMSEMQGGMPGMALDTGPTNGGGQKKKDKKGKK